MLNIKCFYYRLDECNRVYEYDIDDYDHECAGYVYIGTLHNETLAEFIAEYETIDYEILLKEMA